MQIRGHAYVCGMFRSLLILFVTFACISVKKTSAKEIESESARGESGFNTIGSLRLLLKCFPDSQNCQLTSFLHFRPNAGLLFLLLVSFQERQFVRMANTNNQITLPQLSPHYRGKKMKCYKNQTQMTIFSKTCGNLTT